MYLLIREKRFWPFMFLYSIPIALIATLTFSCCLFLWVGVRKAVCAPETGGQGYAVSSEEFLAGCPEDFDMTQDQYDRTAADIRESMKETELNRRMQEMKSPVMVKKDDGHLYWGMKDGEIRLTEDEEIFWREFHDW